MALLAALVGIIIARTGNAEARDSSCEHIILHDVNEDHVALTTVIALHGSPSLHQATFPRALSTLFDSFPIRDLKLTLTRGRWREDWSAALSHQATSTSAVVTSPGG